jgi:hypothetical protein
VPLALVTGVDWYRWVDPASKTRQILEEPRGATIDVTDDELARGVKMGALEPASAATKAATKAKSTVRKAASGAKKRTAARKPASAATKAAPASPAKPTDAKP